MSGIAEVLINQGYEVSGSDLAASDMTRRLEKAGARIHIGHEAEHVENAQVVVVSNAVKGENAEVQAAREKMIPVVPRAEMLAELMRMKYGIAVAGTHGKTTTTSLTAAVLAEGGLDPTVVTGGRLKHLGNHGKLGQSEFLVAEADESDGSFLKLSPTIAVVTTLDEEHLDHYGSLDNMKEAFLSFINRIPFFGAAVLCLDDANIQSLIPEVEKRYVTFGLASQADVAARNIRFEGMTSRFNLFHLGKELGEVETPIPGRHNVQNALAAVAVGLELNLDFETICRALKTFPGVQRRFEVIHDSESCVIVDDYGHHPAEIQATLQAAREVWPGRRLVVVFQPHRYSRTQLLMEQFCASFNNADYLVVTRIYPAGEEPIPGVDARNIAEGVRRLGHKHVNYLEEKKSVLSHLLQTLQPGDVVVALGAGDVWEIGRDLAEKLSQTSNL